MRKITALFLSVLLLGIFPFSAFAEETSRETAYTWAIEAGFPKEFLDSIDNNFLLEIYFDNVNVPSLDITYDVSYYSENGAPVTRGNISSDRLAFWIIGGRVSENGILKYINTYVYYDWASNGMDYNLTDAIVVNWDSSLFYMKDGSFSASFSGETAGTYQTISRPAEAIQGGIGWFVPLTGNYGAPYGNASFELEPNDKNLTNGSSYATSITTTYAHRTFSLSGLTLSTSGGSVSIGGSYDKAADTCTIYYGK